MKKPVENEVKIAVPDARQTRVLLRAHGFRVIRPRVFESNTVLDDPAGRLKESGLLLRVRAAGKVTTCTYKGPSLPGIHKRREEREFTASDPEACLALFKGIGFEPAFHYEKYRTEFRRPGEPGHITLDETPIGIFMELEGAARWINSTAKELGYSRANFITESYTRLYAQWSAEFEADPRAMRFETGD